MTAVRCPGRGAGNEPRGLRVCLTHPAPPRQTGHSRPLLFHNGTWGDWRENLRRMPPYRRPDGLLSNTRVAPSLVDLCGTNVLHRLTRFWAVDVDGELLAVVVYRKGAEAIADMLMRMRARKEAGDAV